MKIKFNLVLKITIGVILITFLSGSVILFNAIKLIDKKFLKENLAKESKNSLGIIDFIIKNRLKELTSIGYEISNKDSVPLSLSIGSLQVKLAKSLKEVMIDNNLDLVNITDQTGLVYSRVRNPSVFNDSLIEDNFVKKALEGISIWGIELVKKNELIKENLLDEVGTQVPSAIMLKATVPIYDKYRYHIIGTVTVGELLNNNISLIKTMKTMGNCEVIIYREDGMPIASSIETKDKIVPPLQIQTSAGTFFEITKVNNSSFFVAKEYIKDFTQKQNIGILSILISEEPFILARNALLRNTFIMFLFAILIITVSSVFYIQRIVTLPIKKLVAGMSQIEKGDLNFRVNIKSSDEIRWLANSFNSMAEKLQLAYQEIRGYSKDLERKVEERTMELKEMQMKMLQSAKMAAVGQLSAGVAHEINNPLAGILGYTQFILNKLEKPNFNLEDFKTCRDYLTYIERESQRCKQVVENLLAFSRKSSEASTPQDIKIIMENTLSILRHSLELQNIKLVAQLPSDLPLVMANANQLQQVFTNIIINAQHAMPKGGQLNIGMKAVSVGKDKQLQISFQDTGCGIPKENLERIFEPFFTTKQDWNSIGLGLSICYEIINQHKGEILVTSEIDKGSTFTVILPCQTQVTQ